MSGSAGSETPRSILESGAIAADREMSSTRCTSPLSEAGASPWRPRPRSNPVDDVPCSSSGCQHVATPSNVRVIKRKAATGSDPWPLAARRTRVTTGDESPAHHVRRANKQATGAAASMALRERSEMGVSEQIQQETQRPRPTLRLECLPWTSCFLGAKYRCSRWPEYTEVRASAASVC